MCWDTIGSLPCFPCAARGFEEPNPDAQEAKDDAEDSAASDREVEAEAATDGGTSVPDTHHIAERLGVRTDLLLHFVQNHPDPTAAIVLGWATDTGGLEDPPGELKKITREWLLANGHGGDLPTSYALPDPGDVVEDREAGEDGEVAVVEIHPDTVAADYVISDIDSTVAEVNRDYDAGAPVVEGVYRDSLEALDGELTLETVRAAVSSGVVASYAFPSDRLASGGGSP
jgi:hypothetical protein